MPDASLFDSLSIVIPTYNRRNLLAKVLDGYREQSSPRLIQELIIADDGSTDDTEGLVRDFSSKAPFQVRYLRQSNKGPAAARNLGIHEAKSNLILFTDSDIIPDRRLVEEHIESHNKNPRTTSAVLGYVTWSAEVQATAFMRWYGEDGRMFGYGKLRGQEKASSHFFYTCNLSLKTEFPRTFGQFDEDFKGAAFEDIELGCRLAKQGLQILYNPAAIGYHHQFFSFSAACRKEREKAIAAQVFLQKESGRQISEESALTTWSNEYPAAKRAAKRVAAVLTRTLAPFRPLLDSKVPLPSFVYELFLWYDLNHGGHIDREVKSSDGD